MKLPICFKPMTAVLLGIVMGVGITPAFAQTYVEPNILELDGNAIDETDAHAADDWGQVPGGGSWPESWGYVAGPNVDGDNPGGDAAISSFINDPNGDSGMDNIFTTGGSKDDLPITGWKWALGTPPDKDDLLQVGAAAYLPDSELLLFDFGTLFAPNGTSSIGNWFFKKDIGPCGDGTFGIVDSGLPNRPCLPDAEQPTLLHTEGDVLIISENTNGGVETNISVYVWVGGNKNLCTDLSPAGYEGSLVPPKDNLCLIGEFAGATCDDVGHTNPWACGKMNQVPTESPDDYGYVPKSLADDTMPADPAGTDGIDADDYPAFTFFESGINISELLGNAECFSSFMKNTRTSASPRSQLKDFASGAFELCGLEVAKDCPVDRDAATGGYCDMTSPFVACEVDSDCGTEGTCVNSNPQFLDGEFVRTQFDVTITRKGPAPMADVELKEVTHSDCFVVAVDGSELASPIDLTQGVFKPVPQVDLLNYESSTVTIECDSTAALSANTVEAKAKTTSGFSVIGPESGGFNASSPGANSCAPAPSGEIAIAKQCNGCPKLIDDGGVLKFEVPVKITVSNLGEEDLSGIIVLDDQFGTVTVDENGFDDPLSIEMGGSAVIYYVEYYTTVPNAVLDQQDWWYGCQVKFTDEAEIIAALGAYNGSYGALGWLPAPVTATCSFCDTACCN